MTDDRLDARWAANPAWKPLSIPLETVRGFVFAPPDDLREWDRLVALLADRRDDFDLLMLARGDGLSGELTSLDEKTIAFRGAAGDVRLDRSSARAVGLNASLVSVPKSDRKRAIVQLADGSIVTVQGARLDAGTLSADAVFGGAVEFPVASVQSIRFLGRRAEPLSNLVPSRYEFTPYVSGDWKLAVDRSSTGGPLRLRGIEFPKGLGMHSRSAVTYDLAGRWERFLATAGIDDAASGGGNIVFAVVVDGERVFASPPQTGSDLPLSIGPIALKGKSRLTLIVEYGQSADVKDYADWCDPTLIRAAK